MTETSMADAPHDLLADGEIDVEGRMPWSSNATFLVTITLDDRETKAIYKPHKGERPLWDFPGGLYRREVAAYELSHWLGWHVVPRTVERDGPYGIGSVQQFVDAEFEQHYFTLLEDPQWHDRLKAIGTFDIIANNADRKGGHCLLDCERSNIWGIDNGLCFHEEPKLRTVVWDFAGQPIPTGLLPDVRRLADAGTDELEPFAGLLTDDEIEAMQSRAADVLKRPHFPAPRTNRAYPWPLV